MSIRPLIAWLAVGGVLLADDPPRFSGRLANGDRVADAEVAWYESNQDPKLAGRNILDGNNPFRWVLNTERPPVTAPRAFVEFVGGDRLPGTVVRVGQDTAFDRWPSHLVVEPSVLLDDPAEQRLTTVRVLTETVSRIAWDASTPRELKPGTVFHRDGRETSFRTLRWGNGAVWVLTAKGLETILTGAIAEVHLPALDPWEVYARELAVLSPRCEDRLICWETADGLVVTGSESRYEAGHRGDRRNHADWFHRVQPAWSLDPFWVRFDGVRSVRIWKPEEVPLSRVRPVAIERTSVFGSSWHPTTDAGVQGTSLRSGDEPFGWGFGVHARTELAFALPPFARTFESNYGLDAVVGAGGAVKMSVHATTEPGATELGQKLYESPLVVGSGEVRSTGGIDVAKLAEEGRGLVLVADMAHGDQPSGGDPFDVRDSCDWLDPILRLDRDALQAEVRRSTSSAIPVLADWEFGGEAPVFIRSHWDRVDSHDPRFLPEVLIEGSYTSWSSTLQFDEEDRWLGIAVHRRGEQKDPASFVQVRFDGEAMGEFEVPHWSDRIGPNPLLVPIAERFRDREVNVQLVVMPAEPGKSAIVWRGVEPTVHKPHLRLVFDEQLDFPDRLEEGTGDATVTLEDSRRLAASLVVTPEGRGAAHLFDPPLSIREHPKVGEFRYLRFAWRKEGGRAIQLRVGHDGEFGVDEQDVQPRILREGPGGFSTRRHRTRDRRGVEVGYTYDSSSVLPPGRAAIRVDKIPPEEWKLVIRDLYGDFGEFELTGFSFDALDGEGAYFDEVFVGRNWPDAASPEQVPKPEWQPDEFDFRERDPWRYRRAIDEVAPGFTSTEIGDGAVRMKEVRGRPNVLRTVEPRDKQPAILRRPLVVPENARLVVEATHEEDRKWRLEVFVDGDRVLSEAISKDMPKDESGWGRFEVDLAKYAGQPVVLAVHHTRQDNRREVGLFGSVRLETK